MAQGAAMAIEDAAVMAQCMAHQPDDAAEALRTYAAARRTRTRRMQLLAARNGARYHLGGVKGRLRDVAMRIMGGKHLLQHYDWVYKWRPPAARSIG
jgi:salicylate hydroxylase